MGALLKCASIVGGTTILENDPPVLDLRDVIYVPLSDTTSQPGLFDHGQKLILQSWYFRGSNPLAENNRLGTPYSLHAIKDVAPDEVYIYGGWLHDHFGHFLLSSLCRFWSPIVSSSTIKILVHSGVEPEDWFVNSWGAPIFEALGITPDRLVRFDRPTRLKSVIIPGPAFQEEGFVHRVYATSLNALGAKITRTLGPLTPDPRPVFLSKQKVRSGVQRVVNEHKIAEVLDRNGVEVIFPEELPFVEQVALWRKRQFFASFANSALHTSIFSSGRDIMTLSYGNTLMSNYALLDTVNGAAARYFRIPPGEIESQGESDGFHVNHVVRNPEAIADSLLRGFDLSQRAAATRMSVPIWPRSGFWRPPAADPLEAGLINLALDKRGRQSSVHPWTPPESGGTTNGALTAEFGFHTENEQGAWWEVDLGSDHSVHRVRLFNRADVAQERCARFSITLTRTDGTVSTEHIQEEPVHFRGLDGDPFEWKLSEPCQARLVRIALLDKNYLHLDQVEVLGLPSIVTPPPAEEVLADEPPPSFISAPHSERQPSWLARLLSSRRRS